MVRTRNEESRAATLDGKPDVSLVLDCGSRLTDMLIGKDDSCFC